jgi:hypothetical protein
MNSERLYRILLNTFPRRYLERYEEPMLQCFRDQLRDADTRGKRLRLWLRTFADLALSVPARYLDDQRRGAFTHYSERAKRAVFFARYVGVSSNSPEITLEHLLLGILREDRTFANAVVGQRGHDAIVRAISGPTVTGGRRIQVARLPFSDQCKQALTSADNRARASQMKINSRHLLAAILDQPQTLAAHLLRENAVDLSSIGNGSVS